jgi:UDP-glucose 4-epimerase
MNRILITGADSFVGRNILKYSRYRKIDEVSLFDKKPEDINFTQYDTVIHLVAIVHQAATIPEEQYFKINCSLTYEVAKAAKNAGVKHFIFMSTIKVYGEYRSETGQWNEDSECHPADSYGRSKYAAELALWNLADNDFLVSVIRTPLVYGEGVKANMLNLIMLIKRSFILPFKDVNNRRNYTAAENLVAFIDRIIERKASGVFIAMDKEGISTTTLVLIIANNLGKKPLMFKVPDCIINTGLKLYPRFFERLYGSYVMDNSYSLRVLNFVPPLSTEEGIKRMINAFIEKS